MGINSPLSGSLVCRQFYYPAFHITLVSCVRREVRQVFYLRLNSDLIASIISCFAFAISFRISRIISSLKFSSSTELGSEKLSPLICFSMVSSLALPNRFREGFGDSEPLRLVLLLLVLFWLLLSLCGSVLDFSHALWRVVDASSLESGSFFSACARRLANVLAISSIIDAIPDEDLPPLEVLLPLFSVTVETGATTAGAVFGG